MKIKSKNKYLNRMNENQEKFLIERFQKEWLEIEKIKNKAELLRKLKFAGIKSGKILLGLAAFGKSGRQLRWFFNEKDLKKNLSVYRRNDYIKFKKDGDGYKIELTDRGRRVFLKSLAGDLRIKKSDRWDGKWWLVTFDISRKHNTARNLFREKLKMIGMERLQDSVFISRCDCREEVLFWASLYNIVDFIQIAKAEFTTSLNV